MVISSCMIRYSLVLNVAKMQHDHHTLFKTNNDQVQGGNVP